MTRGIGAGPDLGYPHYVPLTHLAVKNAAPGEKPYKMTDGQGLFLLVQPSGSRLWRYKYRLGGKEKVLALGAFPAVGLPEARAAHARAWRTVKDGGDPAAERKSRRQASRASRADEPAAINGEPFRSLAKRWFDLRSPAWAKSYADRVWARVDGDLIAEMGDDPVPAVTRAKVLAGLKRISDRGARELARRIRVHAEDIFAVAISEGAIEKNPAAGLTDALPRPGRPKHRARLAAHELPQFFADLERFPGEGLTKDALRLVMLTALRTEEVISADERELYLDGQAPMWRIPPERMKITEGRGEHLVPLSRQAVDLLRRIIARRNATELALRGRSVRPLPGPQTTLLFPASTRTGTISNNTMITALYRMGYGGRATVHGWRSTFSTVLNEAGHFNKDWIERQLAHIDQDEVRSAYNAAEYLPQRRDMMQWWADYLDRQAVVADLL